MTAAAELVSRLAGYRIVVVGDLILDEYMVGRATRLSREAPVPVLEYVRSFTVLGGAANPAHNVVALKGRASVIGVVGDDAAGRSLIDQMAAAGLDVEGVVVDPTRCTTVKTRIVAEGSLIFAQHLARIDRVDRRPVTGEVLTALQAHIERLSEGAHALLISDYGSGVVVPALVETARAVAGARGILMTADSQGRLSAFRGFDLVKCNRAEAEAQLEVSLNTDADFEWAAGRLLSAISVKTLVITRGPDGMTVAVRGRPILHLPAANRSEVFDVTGAGDTVIAVMTLALAAGIEIETAALLANRAAGLVVRRMGNVTVSPVELAAALASEK
ncbi:MAG: bifunctional ADP-heptose synthase [Anaerolineae bacterium]|nr:bifunctional ADP-heptose synthase [Anaerolineae bacterium]MDW8099333.1 bifunctional ADP-heptose synthase [Anaerolineae bacterium]